MSRSYRDDRREEKKWKNELRWADRKVAQRAWFYCNYCHIKFSGHPSRMVNNELTCPLCNDGVCDSDRIR